MTLRCSLLGHDYGESETEREREERGDEVVTTVREVETCARCGAERVVTENTEVTAVAPEPEPEPEPEATPAPDADVGGDAGSSYADTPVEPSGAGEDDAVILEDEPEEEERTPGAWPDAEDTRVEDEADGAPPVEEVSEQSGGATDEGPGAGAPAPDEPSPPAEEDAEVLDAGPEPTGDEADTEDPADDAAGTSGAVDDGADAVGTEPADETSESPDENVTPAGIKVAESRPDEGDVDVEARLVCPNCGFEEGSLGSSHRQGDICPSCQAGYLAER